MLKASEDAFSGPSVQPVTGTEAESLRMRRQRQILDAARISFAREGFHGTSMQTICNEAEMSPGALYRYFPSKEAIIAAIADEEQRLGLELVGGLDQGESFAATLVEATLQHLQDMERPGAFALMLEIMSEGLRNPAVAEHFRRSECTVRMAILESARRAQADGRVDPAVDVEGAVSVAMATAEGLVLRGACQQAQSPERLRPLLSALFAALFPAPPVPNSPPVTGD